MKRSVATVVLALSVGLAACDDRSQAAPEQPAETEQMPIASPEQRARFLETGDDALLPIIDPHHHFFDLGRNHHPWLSDHILTNFRYGDYAAIRQGLPDLGSG